MRSSLLFVSFQVKYVVHWICAASCSTLSSSSDSCVQMSCFVVFYSFHVKSLSCFRKLPIHLRPRSRSSAGKFRELYPRTGQLYLTSPVVSSKCKKLSFLPLPQTWTCTLSFSFSIHYFEMSLILTHWMN